MTRIIVLLTLMSLPAALSAQSTCADKHQAQSCASGSQWNAETKTCEQAVTG